MTATPYRIEALGKNHGRTAFDCGSAAHQQPRRLFLPMKSVAGLFDD